MSVVTFHIGFMIYTLSVIFLADKEAMAWIRGSKMYLDEKRLRIYHYLTWLGLLLLISSGILLVYSAYGYYFSNPFFIIKLLFVGILLTNAILLGRFMPLATKRSYNGLTTDEKLPLLASGVISTFAWASVIFIGFFLL